MATIERVSRLLRSLATVVVCLLAMTAGRAAAEDYVLNSSLSQIEVTVNGGLWTFPEQFDGSRILSFGGTIVADRSSGIEFLDDTEIDAIVQGEDVAPGVDGVATPDEGDAGMEVRLIGILLGNAALRDVTATLVSSNLTVSDGEFDADGVALTLLSGSALDYRITFGTTFAGRESLEGEGATNDTGDVGTLVTTMTTETLTLPVNIDFEVEFESNTFNVNLNGELVGVATLGQFLQVPEPSTYALLGVGMAALVPLARRRLRLRRRNV